MPATTSDIISPQAPFFMVNVKSIMAKTKQELIEILQDLHHQYIGTLGEEELETLQTMTIVMAKKVAEARQRHSR